MHASQPSGPVLGPGQYFYVKSLDTVGVPNMEESMLGGPVTTGVPTIVTQPQSGGPVTYGGVDHICTMIRELWFAADGSGRMVWTPAGHQSTSAAQGCHTVTQTMPANNAHMSEKPSANSSSAFPRSDLFWMVFMDATYWYNMVE